MISSSWAPGLLSVVMLGMLCCFGAATTEDVDCQEVDCQSADDASLLASRRTLNQPYGYHHGASDYSKQGYSQHHYKVHHKYHGADHYGRQKYSHHGQYGGSFGFGGGHQGPTAVSTAAPTAAPPLKPVMVPGKAPVPLMNPTAVPQQVPQLAPTTSTTTTTSSTASTGTATPKPVSSTVARQLIGKLVAQNFPLNPQLLTTPPSNSGPSVQDRGQREAGCKGVTDSSLQASMTMSGQNNHSCAVCGDVKTGQGCSDLDLVVPSQTQCPIGFDSCYTYIVKPPGQVSHSYDFKVYQGCATSDMCRWCWWEASSDKKLCQHDPMSDLSQTLDEEHCNVCCVGDFCNQRMAWQPTGGTHIWTSADWHP